MVPRHRGAHGPTARPPKPPVSYRPPAWPSYALCPRTLVTALDNVLLSARGPLEAESCVNHPEGGGDDEASGHVRGHRDIARCSCHVLMLAVDAVLRYPADPGPNLGPLVEAGSQDGPRLRIARGASLPPISERPSDATGDLGIRPADRLKRIVIRHRTWLRCVRSSFPMRPV